MHFFLLMYEKQRTKADWMQLAGMQQMVEKKSIQGFEKIPKKMNKWVYANVR